MVVVHGCRLGQAAAATNKTRTVGFVGDRLDIGAMGRQQVAHPRHRFAAGARSAGADNGLQGRHQLGLHKQVAERRVQGIGQGRGEHHFGVTGDLDGATHAGAVGQGDTAQLDIVLGGDDDLGMGIEVPFPHAKFGPRIGEDRLVALRLLERRLVCTGPELAAGDIAQVAEHAPVVGADVLVPAGHGQLAAAAVAAPGAADHDVIAAIGEQLHGRALTVGVGDHPQAGFCLGTGGG